MSAMLHERQDDSHGRSPGGNVVLYYSDIPVLIVEQGTTLGLVKLLHESIGGRAQIIGLRQRRNAYALPCYITHDGTVLTEGEYDIILRVKDDLSRRNEPCKDNERLGSQKPQIRQNSVPATDKMEYETNGKEAKINWADQESREIPVTYYPKNTDPSVFSTKSPRWVIQYSPSQIAPQSPDDQNEEIRVASPCSSTSSSTTSSENPRAPKQDLPSNYKMKQRQSRTRKWQCCYCQKFLLCRSAYENHLRTHTGEKPFPCNVCDRSFGNKGNLIQHMHIHRDVKPHICDFCGRGFTRSNRLRDHRRLHHQQEYELFVYRNASVLNFANY